MAIFEMMDGMDFVDDVDTEKVFLRGYVHFVHFVHNVHSVHCLGRFNGRQPPNLGSSVRGPDERSLLYIAEAAVLSFAWTCLAGSRNDRYDRRVNPGRKNGVRFQEAKAGTAAEAAVPC